MAYAPDLQRLSQEVARDPASLAFLPLARAYRRQGQREAALRLCLRGLERHPTHVEAHTLLALLYLEAGDRERAFDEWATALRFDPENFDAHRGMGFLCLERGEYNAACWHLERAAEQRPQDATVQEALGLARERQAAAGMAPAAPAYLYASAPAAVVDPARVFEPLLAETPFLGAMVVDRQGLLLAGTFADGDHARAEALAAMLDGGVQEAERAAVYLSLGEWRGMVLETDAATLHLSRLDGGYTLVVAVTHEAPAGWLLRTAARAAALAQPLLETAA